MTTAENLARLFPLRYQRIVELTHDYGVPYTLKQPSQSRWYDLAGLFIWSRTEEGHDYWRALATGEGIQ